MDGIVYNIQRMSARIAPVCGPRSFSKAARCTVRGAATPNPQSFKPQLVFFPIYAWGAAFASGFARTVPWSKIGDVYNRGSFGLHGCGLCVESCPSKARGNVRKTPDRGRVMRVVDATACFMTIPAAA